MEGWISLVIIIIGAIVLLRRTGNQQEQLNRSFERIKLLETKVQALEEAVVHEPVKAFLAVPPALPTDVPAILPENSSEKDEQPVAPARAIMSFIRGGNLWAAGGIILLTAAFAMLIVYMARHGVFTVEMGIAAAGISGLVMLILGWRFRQQRAVYFLVLQGGGIGILYLSVFAAHKVTPYVPFPVSILLISILIPLVVILALLQNSQTLALFGFLGGFAAPILLAEGSGSPVFLFSYYLVLNLGVLAIGYFRLWKGLNLLAFLCTMGSSLFWTLNHYEPALFWTTEPFFIGFTGIFTLLGIHLIRDTKQRDPHDPVKPPIDTIDRLDLVLVLGTPVVTALLQWRVFSAVDHGYAIISILFAALYLWFTGIIRKRMGEHLRRLVEGYLGLAVLLANLVIPLELAPHITSAIWAVEGVALIFFSRRLRDHLKLNSLWVMVAGFILHIAGALAFVLGNSPTDSGEPALRSLRFTGSLIIGVSALVIIALINQFRRLSSEVSGFAEMPKVNEGIPWEAWFPGVSTILGIWAYSWWFGGWLWELNRSLRHPWEAFFILSSLTALGAFGGGGYCRCPVFKLGIIPALGFALIMPIGVLMGRTGNYFSRPSMIFIHNFFEEAYLWGWLLFSAVQGVLLTMEGKAVAEKKSGAEVHGVWIFLVVLITLTVLTSSARAYTRLWNLAQSWTSLAGILPVIGTLVLVSLLSSSTFGVSIAGVSMMYRNLLFRILPLILSVIPGLWFLVTLFLAGDPAPLPWYIPIISPLDVQQGLCIGAILLWQLRGLMMPVSGGKARATILGDVMVFLWITAIIARSIHFYGDLPLSRVLESGAFHLCLFIFWAVYGIAHIIAGHRLALRPIWIAGAVLTVTDIAKLLLFDLADTGAVTRILSFFIAGLILLFIGWAAPLPPATPKESGFS
ncbi:MAG: DUF2339 domain-containing protein [Treponema sp.]|jgi:uncharacterized membrane protein|nr:DUF2339 domain-containing protein [Treponema sp.]